MSVDLSIGSIAVGHVERIKYAVIIHTDPAGDNMIAFRIAVIASGCGSLLHSDVCQLLTDVKA